MMHDCKKGGGNGVKKCGIRKEYLADYLYLIIIRLTTIVIDFKVGQLCKSNVV
jgi:hypothetical protein